MDWQMYEFLGIALFAMAWLAFSFLIRKTPLDEAAAPYCTICGTETYLVEQEYEHLGEGWIQIEHLFRCPQCLATTRRGFLCGPTDFVNLI